MTASTVKSTKVSTTFDSTPRVVQSSSATGGLLKIVTDTIEAATTSIDEINDVILMLPLPSNAVIHSLRSFTDDLDSNASPALAVKIGVANGPELFKIGSTNYAAYTVLDADNIAAATAFGQSADVAGTERLHTSNDIANANKQLWDIAGLASDPNKMFVIALTVTTAAATAVTGTITLKAIYSV